MSSIRQNNRAAGLLAEIRAEDRLSLERLSLLIGVGAETLYDCRDNWAPLATMVQIRLARAVVASIPRLARRAHRLEGQATAAASFEAGTNALHLTSPGRWR